MSCVCVLRLVCVLCLVYVCVCKCVREPDKSNLLSAKRAHFEVLQLHKGIAVIRAGRASPKSQGRCQLPISLEICVGLSLTLSFSLYPSPSPSVCLFGLSVFRLFAPSPAQYSQ